MHASLIGYSDADYAGDVDTRKSTSGYLFLFNGGPAVWGSDRQTCTALSTTESELIAVRETTNKLSGILSEICGHEQGPVTVFSDHQSAIKLVHDPEYRQRSKHIDVKHNFVYTATVGTQVPIIYLTRSGRRVFAPRHLAEFDTTTRLQPRRPH